MDKPPLILTRADSDEETRLDSGSSMQDGVVTISKRLFFKVPNGTSPRDYNDLDVYSHASFPKKNSALSQDARYKFYGNATVSHEQSDSKYFTAELEYSSENPNATDNGGNAVTNATAPWNLRPDNITFTYPEVVAPFEASYNSTGKLYQTRGKDYNGNIVYTPVLPVANSAGDKFPAERSLRNMQMSFTFAARSWNINNALNYGNTINNNEVTICGVSIPAGMALLLPPECSYVATYEDNSSKIKWQYWSVNINIMVDTTGLLLLRRIMNIGDRAIFPAQQFNDDLVSGFVPAETGVSQICRFRKAQKASYTSPSGKEVYLPTGNAVYCGWNQFIAIRQAYIAATTNNPYTDIYDCQCEQLSQMPLVARGAKSGLLDLDAVDGLKNYDTLSFQEYPHKSWNSLNLPKKGIKW